MKHFVWYSHISTFLAPHFFSFFNFLLKKKSVFFWGGGFGTFQYPLILWCFHLPEVKKTWCFACLLYKQPFVIWGVCMHRFVLCYYHIWISMNYCVCKDSSEMIQHWICQRQLEENQWERRKTSSALEVEFWQQLEKHKLWQEEIYPSTWCIMHYMWKI